MRREDFYFDSNDGKTKIHGVKWIPDSDIKMILHIVHGVTEHILRYEEVAKYFNDLGIMVVGIDLIGHGTSICGDSKPMYFGGNGSWNYVVRDLDTCKRMIQASIDLDIPYIMLGFTLGSYLARTYATYYVDSLSGLILVGTGQISNLEIYLARFIVNREIKKYGEDESTDMIRKLTFETYNKKFRPNRTAYDWLCSSNSALDKYIADPLRGGDMSGGLFREMLWGMEYTGNIKNIDKMNKKVPILILSGSDDPVGGFTKGVKKFNSLLEKVNIEDVSMKIYPNLRHDILHEDIYMDILNDIKEWLKLKI